MLYQSSRAYQSVPVQFERAQFIGARALQKQILVKRVQPMLDAWKGRQEPSAQAGMERKSISEHRPRSNTRRERRRMVYRSIGELRRMFE